MRMAKVLVERSQGVTIQLGTEEALGTAWDRWSLHGSCRMKHRLPGVSNWLSPPQEKLTSDSSQQPCS